MQGKRQMSAGLPGRDRTTQLRKPTSKELDLFLLAGCSCLLTVLYHPVANALQTSVSQQATTAIAAPANPSTNSMNAFHLIVPNQSDRRDEDDA